MPPQRDQTIAAFAPSGGGGGGKSELRRAVRRVTPGRGNSKESGTENIPPTCVAGFIAGSETGKGEKVR